MRAALEALGYVVVGDPAADYFTYEPDEPYEYIVTNPPFSMRIEVIERAVALGKHWCLMLPVNTFETQGRQNLLQDAVPNLTFVPIPTRPVFLAADGGPGGKNPYPCAWFCDLHGTGPAGIVYPPRPASVAPPTLARKRRREPAGAPAAKRQAVAAEDEPEAVASAPGT